MRLPPHPKVLAVFALLVTTVVSVTHCTTADKIANNQAQNLQKQLAQVLPAETFDNRLYDNPINIYDHTSEQNRTIYRATFNNKPTAAIITATAPDGYVGDINLLIGIYKNGTIATVRVTGHRETPGLGDRIEYRRSDWITGFDGFTAAEPTVWAVKKDNGDFDQLTGATVTSRAVVSAIRDTLTFFHSHSDQILNVE